MNINKDQGPKRVRFVDDPDVHAYTPDTSQGSASSDELRTPSDNGTLPLPSMANYIAQCTTWAPGFVPSTVLLPPGYMLVAPPLPPPLPAPIGYRAPLPVSVPSPGIHPALARPPFLWDVRAALPPTDQPYRAEPAFSPPAASATLRFTPGVGVGVGGDFDFAYPIASAGGAPLRVVDVLRAVHAALYARASAPRDPAMRRAAEAARGYRALKHDGNSEGGGLLRVDLYPVEPNRADGARLLFVGLEWAAGGGRGEVRVVLHPGA